MNSYMRQASMPMEQMHSFLRDKQAWENAIAVYEGPDPLDHWYNYVCWYENHLHGDTPSDYRRTLERCLTIFEHSTYYYNDQRLVRLWLKYVAMQDDRAKERYFKVLHNRGVGKQIASLYVSWANFYESINQLHDAENTYNLAFQEEAQPYIEIQNAHHKFLYKCSMLRDQHRIKQQFQQQLQIDHQHQSPNQQLGQPHHTQHHASQHHLQHDQPVNFQQPQQQEPQQNQMDYPQQHHGAHMPIQSVQMHQSQFPQYRFPELYQHQVHHHQQQTAPHPHMPVQHPAQQQQHSSPMYGQLAHFPNQHTHEQSHFQFQSQNAYEENSPITTSVYNVAEQTSSGSRENEDRSIAAQGIQAASYNNQVQQPQHEEQSKQQQKESVNHTTIRNESVEQSLSSITPFKYPKHFYSYSRNNYEMLETALFLEEPADPCRECHYDKKRVYPPDSGTEFSPEELRAAKYLKRIKEVRLQRQKAASLSKGKKIDETATQYQQHNQNHQVQNLNVQQYDAAATGYSGVNNLNNNNIYRGVSDDYEDNDFDDDNEDGDEIISNYTINSSQHNHTASTIVTEMKNHMITSNASLDAPSPDKTSLKIKFKKKRLHGEGTSNDNLYTIESISQLESFNSIGQDTSIRRNGFIFHPYKSSTPKSTLKRTKSKLKKPTKSSIPHCSSSNSSSADNHVGINGFMEKVRYSDHTITNAAFNDNANYSFSSAVTHDNSNCSSIGPSSYHSEVTVAANTTAAAEVSNFQENSYFATQNDAEAKQRRLQRALDTIEMHMARPDLDPFNSELLRSFLTKIGFPGGQDTNANYKVIQTTLPKLIIGRAAAVTENTSFIIEKEVGRGSYGWVYKATDTSTNDVVALKFQKPASTWEIYICDQVLKRIKTEHVLPGLMNISTAIIAPNASLIATEFSQYGSLLDVNNKVRQATQKAMPEILVMLFSAQICEIIHYLHRSEIIHADIKPDNFLLMRVPNSSDCPSVRLIDFGCAIDMKLFPKNTRFRKKIETDGFKCIEMQEGRTWTYETDYFCVVATIYVMLMGEYMQIQKRSAVWDTKTKIPRYLRRDIWTQFYRDMLNLKANDLPDLLGMRDMFKSEVSKCDSELQNHIRTLSNILHRR